MMMKLYVSFVVNYIIMVENIELNFIEFYSLVVLRIFIEISGLFLIKFGISYLFAICFIERKYYL